MTVIRSEPDSLTVSWKIFSSIFFFGCISALSLVNQTKHWRQCRCCCSHLSYRLPQHPPRPCWFVLEPAGGALQVHSYSVGKTAAPVTTVSLNVLNSLWTIPILRWESNKSTGLMVCWSRMFPFSLCLVFSKMQLNKLLGVEYLCIINIHISLTTVAWFMRQKSFVLTWTWLVVPGVPIRIFPLLQFVCSHMFHEQQCLGPSDDTLTSSASSTVSSSQSTAGTVFQCVWVFALCPGSVIWPLFL